MPCFTVPTSKLNKRKEGRQERKGREMRRESGGEEGREEGGGGRRKEENIATETSTTQSTAEEAPVHK